ncbi:MAG TPA: hypothetical protein VHF25_04895, partial [Nitriliruptorales bacterium]|nr:hypothetical protein [Nitriliruptorales bacterium]
HVGDLATVADAVGARVVGGVSLGAHAAAAFAATRSGLDGVLVCLPAWTGRSAPGVGVHAAVAEAVRHDGVAAVLARAVTDPSIPGWLVRTLARDWPTHDVASLAASLLALDGGRAPTDAELARVWCPAAVVGWSGDAAHPLTVAEHWARALPRAELAVTSLQDGGEEPARLGAAAVAAWRRAAARPTVTPTVRVGEPHDGGPHRPNGL